MIYNSTSACRVLYFIISAYMGLWIIRIPTIRDQISTDYIGIGYIYFIYAVGSITTMIFATNLIKSFTSKKVILYGLILLGFIWLFVPFINNLQIFLLISFILGSCYGIFEIAINLQATQIEKNIKKSVMSSIHVFWSIGILVGSIITSIFLQFKISFLINIIFYLIIFIPITFFSVGFLQKDEVQKDTNKKNIFFIWPIILFLLVIISISSSLAEGSVDSWGSLYMKDIINVTGFSVGIASISFNIFMIIGRLFGDKLRDNLGLYSFLVILIFLNILGLLIIFYFSSIFSSIIGFAILGLGSSSIIPITYSLASKIKGVDSTVAITIVSIVVYIFFILGPASLGFIANILVVNYIFIPIIIFFLLSFLLIFIYKRKFLSLSNH